MALPDPPRSPAPSSRPFSTWASLDGGARTCAARARRDRTCSADGAVPSDGEDGCTKAGAASNPSRASVLNARPTDASAPKERKELGHCIQDTDLLTTRIHLELLSARASDPPSFGSLPGGAAADVSENKLMEIPLGAAADVSQPCGSHSC